MILTRGRRNAYMLATTFNPADKGDGITLSSGDLSVGHTIDNQNRSVRTLGSRGSGKHYFELRLDSQGSTDAVGFGVADSAYDVDFPSMPGGWLGGSVDSIGIYNGTGWAIWTFGPGNVEGVDYLINDTGVGWSVGDWVGFAIDLDASKIWHRNVSGWYGNPAAGTGAVFNLTPSTNYFPAVSLLNIADSATANFGASAFAYAVPSGFSAFR